MTLPYPLSAEDEQPSVARQVTRPAIALDTQPHEVQGALSQQDRPNLSLAAISDSCKLRRRPLIHGVRVDWLRGWS
jgi:hypothetical protein